MFYPIGYGADPAGAQDSSDAILQALSDAFQLRTGLELLSGISDFGGLTIDLQGGNYKISKPIRFPPGGGNIVVSFSLSLSHPACLLSEEIFTTNETESPIFLQRVMYKKSSYKLCSSLHKTLK